MRIKEHLNPKSDSAVQSHYALCKGCQKHSDFVSQFSVLKACRSGKEAEIVESMLISNLKPVLNKQMLTNGKSFLLDIFK